MENFLARLPASLIGDFRPIFKGFEVKKLIMTALTRCWHILKTVKNVTDRPSVHKKMTHFAGGF